ncbi:MAG: RHS repeat-associated core domain-containing protein [Clostridia bacterium]|nr:RHS repeat-associated core domain-containing protein [Clostridia bacterium]
MKNYYEYDAFGNMESTSTTDTENPFKYCGEYVDEETGFVYLRNRYYDPSIGCFTTIDPAMDGDNWYVYCANNPVMLVDPTGNIREPGYVNGRWTINPDATEFDRRSSTYKILVDLGNRWNNTNDKSEKNRLHNLANDVRCKAREGTPYMYGQDVIINTLHKNVKEAEQYVNLYNKNPTYNSEMPTPYVWFVNKTCTDWDYKKNNNWQVKYKKFNGYDMNERQRDGGYPKNWMSWIYFDGQVMGADKVGNLNLGYVGRKMGFDGYLLKNPATTGGGDGYWVQYGIDMASQGR